MSAASLVRGRDRVARNRARPRHSHRGRERNEVLALLVPMTRDMVEETVPPANTDG